MGRVNSMSLLLHHKELNKFVVRQSGDVVSEQLNSLLGLDIG